MNLGGANTINAPSGNTMVGGDGAQATCFSAIALGAGATANGDFAIAMGFAKGGVGGRAGVTFAW